MKDNQKKILFISQGTHISVGSYRIWVNDYCSYFNELGIPAKITHMLKPSEIEENDIFILGKGSEGFCKKITSFIHQNYSNKIVGAITPPRDWNHIDFDFVMAGSMEEGDSLSFHKNIIVNAHIENLFLNATPKKHNSSKKLKIGYHGWTAHLASFFPNLKWALEEFSKEQEFELVIISETDSINWKPGTKPQIENIVAKKWDISTIKEHIQSCDIGIIPGIHDLTQNLDTINPTHGLFSTDYIFRVKNKCNNGRAIVFFQLGVPVVADFTPSHLHILGDGDCGYLAHSKHGWLRGLRRLKESTHRNQISTNAFKKVQAEYDPHIWAQKYYNQLCGIHDEKQRSLENNG